MGSTAAEEEAERRELPEATVPSLKKARAARDWIKKDCAFMVGMREVVEVGRLVCVAGRSMLRQLKKEIIIK